MTESAAIKSYGSDEITQPQLEKIHSYTRRPLAPEELYVFGVNLCDNEVDRDGERFTIESLKALEALFLGKTGIFDHDPRGGNQTARIFETRVEAHPGRTTSAGEVYHCLRATAYMVRSAKNADLILEIDGGIKKEVSVSCAVSKRSCSICGADLGKGSCPHQPGKVYDDGAGPKKCHILLESPTDAYEWSFVAIPAQPGAGVTKSHLPCGQDDPKVWELLKGLREGKTTLTREEADRLGNRLTQLEGLAQAGRSYLEALRKDYVRLSCAACPRLEPAVARRVCEKMELEELCHCNRALEEAAQKRFPARLQLQGEPREELLNSNRDFKI